MSPRDTQTMAIRQKIKPGYVLHIDPDYLFLTYGDITTGILPRHTIGARYAMCVGVGVGDDEEATFWVLLSTQNGDSKQEIPVKAKVGSWVEGGDPRTSYFSTDQILVATRDMIIDAHFQANPVRPTFKHNHVKVEMIKNWPGIPPTYPKRFTPIDRLRPEPTAPQFVKPVAEEATPEPLMAQAAPDESEVQVGAIDREAHVQLALKLLNNPRLTDVEVARLVDHLQTSVIDTLLGA